MANEVMKTDTGGEYKTLLVKQNETYTNMLANSLQSMNIDFSAYKKTCVIGCLSIMATMLDKAGMKFKDIESTNITSILQTISLLEINLAVSPREGFLQFRNVKIIDENGKESYRKEFELGIEGDGNDAILRKYGVDVADVKGPYVVREGDEFTYPSFDGEKMIPPTWKPKSYYRKATKVFYIVTKKSDGQKEYLIAEREGVVHNLQAHINQNMMSAPSAVKQEILDKIDATTLEEILNDESLRSLTYTKYNPYKKTEEEVTVTLISGAWLNPHSREAMIERKMKNNATKKYPKDFRNAFVERAFETTFEDYDQYRNQEKTVLDYTDDRAKTVDEHEADIDEKTGVKGIEKKRFSDSVIPVRSDPKKGDEQLLKVDASTGETDEGF